MWCYLTSNHLYTYYIWFLNTCFVDIISNDPEFILLRRGIQETLCTISALRRHSYPFCDSAVVKVDERKKLCLITQRFVYYYLLSAVIEWKKESMETETIALGRHREVTYPGEEKRGDRDLEIFKVHNVFVFINISGLLTFLGLFNAKRLLLLLLLLLINLLFNIEIFLSERL